MELQGKFYLGRIFDPQTGKTGDQPLIYDAEDLTTHGFVVGMTGSGKTGLCIDLLEEAALQNIPALMIDPKGDITNALLHFPDLLPQDFEPWVNVDEARRQNKTIPQAAGEAAALWSKGLAEWGVTPERLRALQNAAHFAIFTPGSDAGIPVSILASLKAPPIPWETNREVLREKISGTVTGLLGLVGLQDIDPVRSREHILLSNIFENAWSQGRDLDLGELILQTQSPPFPKLGVFDVNTFFPEKDRFTLAMLLNNILAAPAFQTWLEGQPLDVPGLLYGPDGRPRHSIFYIAHLSDAERMFFVTLLFSAVETWMRTQTGTTSLRALLYFDEIYGYLPPTSNPPSKQPMLRMLKQARAFGVGLLLATQNPVDIDYKALSNTGSWFIGKLQTDRDKQRLLDGLEGAAPGLDRAEYDRLLSSLGKRVFLVHNVHEKQPQLFQTRWAMNYLPGPLTRTQIPALNALVGAGASFKTPVIPAAPAQPAPAYSAPAATPPPGAMSAVPPQAAPVIPAAQLTGSSSLPGSETRPALPARITEYFLPNNLTLSQAYKALGRSATGEVRQVGLLYRPVLLGQVYIRYLNRKYNLDSEQVKTALVIEPDRRGNVRWENYLDREVRAADLDSSPDPTARFAALEAPFNDARLLKDLEKDFADWVFRGATVQVWANEDLKTYAGPELTQAEFRTQCAEAARKLRDAEIDKATTALERSLAALKDKLSREKRELDQDEAELSQRKMEEMGTHAENIFSLFSKRKRTMTTSLTKRRLTEQAKADVEESKDAIEDLTRQLAKAEKDHEAVLAEINARWGELANRITQIPVAPLRKDVRLDLFGVAWLPYHLVEQDGRLQELPGYGEG